MQGLNTLRVNLNEAALQSEQLKKYMKQAFQLYRQIAAEDFLNPSRANRASCHCKQLITPLFCSIGGRLVMLSN